jgi:hypothetical protein
MDKFVRQLIAITALSVHIWRQVLVSQKGENCRVRDSLTVIAFRDHAGQFSPSVISTYITPIFY